MNRQSSLKKSIRSTRAVSTTRIVKGKSIKNQITKNPKMVDLDQVLHEFIYLVKFFSGARHAQPNLADEVDSVSLYIQSTRSAVDDYLASSQGPVSELKQARSPIPYYGGLSSAASVSSQASPFVVSSVPVVPEVNPVLEPSLPAIILDSSDQFLALLPGYSALLNSQSSFDAVLQSSDQLFAMNIENPASGTSDNCLEAQESKGLFPILIVTIMFFQHPQPTA